VSADRVHNDGYVRLYRKSLGSAVWRDPLTWKFWCWCLMKATYKPRQIIVNHVPVDLQSGQFVFGRQACCQETGLSARQTRTRLKTLEKAKNLTIQTTNRFSVVTVCNWETYQGNGNGERPAERHTSDQQATSKRPAGDHKQEGKEGKTDKKNTHRARMSYPDDFERFWSAYPRKVGKRKAAEVWARLKKSGELPPAKTLEFALETQAASLDWRREQGRFIPHPTTWLNRGQWEDGDELFDGADGGQGNYKEPTRLDD